MLDKMTVGSIVRDCDGDLLLIVSKSVKLCGDEEYYCWKFTLLGKEKREYRKSMGIPKGYGSEKIEETLTYFYQFVS